MNKYLVTIEASTSKEIEVYADSEFEASQYAEEDFSSNHFSSDLELTFHTVRIKGEKK